MIEYYCWIWLVKKLVILPQNLLLYPWNTHNLAQTQPNKNKTGLSETVKLHLQLKWSAQKYTIFINNLVFRNKWFCKWKSHFLRVLGAIVQHRECINRFHARATKKVKNWLFQSIFSTIVSYFFYVDRLIFFHLNTFLMNKILLLLHAGLSSRAAYIFSIMLISNM